MNNEVLITTGILVSLIGTFAGGIISLFGKNNFIQRTAQIVTALALLLGTASSGAFLMMNLQPLTIFNLGTLFPGQFVIDHLSAIFFLLVNAVGFLATIYGTRYVLNEAHLYNISYVQFLTSFFLLGMQMVVLSTNAVSFLFSWEVMSLSSFLLVIADFKHSSIRAAIFYLIMTHLGAGALLAGFLLLSGGSLSLNFSQIAQLVPQMSSITAISAFLLFFFGFGSKSGLFPFHGWLPEAHPQAPSHISALMSGIMLKIAVYGFLRVILFMLPVMPIEIGMTVTVIGLFSAVFGVLYATIETDIKRILAFSSIENLGLIFTMIGIYLIAKNLQMDLLAQISLIVILFQSICHAFFKSGLFMSAGVIAQTFHTRNIEKMGGMAKNMKLFSFAVLLLALTAAALPPSGAFIGEWIILQTIIGTLAIAPLGFKIILLLTFVVFGFVAGMAVFAMVRFFGIAFLAKSRTTNAHVEANLKHDPQAELLIPIVILAFVVFGLGSIAQFITKIIGNGILTESYQKTFDTSFNLFGTSFNPSMLLVIIVAAILAAYLFRYFTSNRKNERQYHSWDCGQPIDASMEYTGTAFASPLRFFFNMILRTNKKVESKPVLASNPWITKKSISIETYPIWDQYFYEPIVKLVAFISAKIRKLQSGIIQFYIALILITLVITAIATL
jgi:hydrogenase-4 component B